MREASVRLAEAGAGSPRVDAELLLAHVLGVPRGRLVTAPDPTVAQQTEFDRLVGARARRVPLQHLTGRAPFRHLELRVGPGVFVPRPETELLVDLVAAGLRAAEVVVDLCSGSGALALAVAQEFAPEQVLAVEYSEPALSWLRANVVERAAAGDPVVQVAAGDVRDPELLAGFDGRVDVVLCNPPYVPSGLRGTVAPEVGLDPDDAVFAGADGLDLIPAVLTMAARLLRPGGVLALEHDDSHQPTVLGLLGPGWTDVTGHPDLTGRPRFVTARR